MEIRVNDRDPRKMTSDASLTRWEYNSSYMRVQSEIPLLLCIYGQQMNDWCEPLVHFMVVGLCHFT